MILELTWFFKQLQDVLTKHSVERELEVAIGNLLATISMATNFSAIQLRNTLLCQDENVKKDALANLGGQLRNFEWLNNLCALAANSALLFDGLLAQLQGQDHQALRHSLQQLVTAESVMINLLFGLFAPPEQADQLDGWIEKQLVDLREANQQTTEILKQLKCA